MKEEEVWIYYRCSHREVLFRTNPSDLSMAMFYRRHMRGRRYASITLTIEEGYQVWKNEKLNRITYRVYRRGWEVIGTNFEFASTRRVNSWKKRYKLQEIFKKLENGN